jgi:DNA-binding CsgD family transcriptional regulator
VRTVGIAEDITLGKEAEEFLHIERDLALGLGSTGSLTEALELILEACLKIDALDSGGIHLVESETGALRFICHQGLSDGFVEHVSFYEPSSTRAHFVMRGEPGYWTRPEGIHKIGDLYEREGITALAVIPVMAEGKAIAVLNLSSHTQPEIPVPIRSALETIATHIGGIILRVRLAETIKAQGERLREANAALKVLLKQREEDRAELEKSILENVKHLILPYLEKLKKGRLAEDQRLYLDIAESHLEEITSTFVRRVSTRFLGLTPTEIRVSDLIRQGKTSKEIAELLGSSERAIVFHRQSIRGKLGLKKKKVNLQSYLASLSK